MAQENAAVSHPIKNFAISSQTELTIEQQVQKLINRDFFTSTSNVAQLHTWLDEQRKYKALGIVIGAQGVGKTIGLKTYKNPRGDQSLRSLPLHALYIEPI